MDHSGGSNSESTYDRMVRQTRLLATMPCMHKETREVPCVPPPGCLTCGAREIVRMLDAEPEPPEEDEVRFQWQVGRLRLGQAVRAIKSAAHMAGVRLAIEEVPGWPWCAIFATVRGTEEEIADFEDLLPGPLQVDQ